MLDTFSILSKNESDIHYTLTIAGDGSALDSAILYAKEHHINAIFLGYVSGQKKGDILNCSDILFFPSSYGEGLPCSILEGMGFSLCILTRNVGGIPDFFENEKMGLMTDSLDPEFFAKVINDYSKDPVRLNSIKQYNKQYAYDHFRAEVVAQRLEKGLSI